MTNEEKAREIENDIVFRENQPIYFMAIREAALKMAEWKDQQFNELHNPAYSIGFADGRNVGMEEMKQQFKEYLENTIKAYKCRGEAFFTGEIKVLEEIINKFFEGNNYDKRRSKRNSSTLG